MGVAGWVVLACVAGVALKVASGQDRPDITMLYKGDSKICVAGDNTNGYGLAFMSETLTDNIYINHFEYRVGNGSIIDHSSDCDFEQRPGDSCWDNWRSADILLQQSGLDPIFPVTDERWNNFEVYHTDGRNFAPPTYDRRYDIRQGNFFTGISIRAKQNAQILLCSGRKKPKNGACYWIIIDGFKNLDVTTIRKCINGVPDTHAVEPECKMLRANITTPEKLLHESQWTHFLLSREGGNRVQLWLWDLDTGARPLLDYTDNDPLSLTYMYVRSYHATADWKVHQYHYANILYRKGLIRLGPPITFTQTSSICVSLYVTMCSNCKIDIRLEKDGGSLEIKTSIEGYSNRTFMTWRNIRLKSGVSASSIEHYQLYITLSTKDGKNENTFLAVDDFRKCSNNDFEYREGSTIDISNNCDFEQRPRDKCWEDYWRSANIVLHQSGSDPIFPVTDERWNDFEVHHTDGRNFAPPTYDKRYDIKQDKFFTGISIRSAQNAQILLCSTEEKPNIGACYWIIIDGFDNFDITTIRKCISGIPNRWATKSDCQMRRATITTPEKLLNESQWRHFMLSREDGNRIRLWQWNLARGARLLLDYTDNDPLSLTSMYVRSYNATANWKIHIYQYANILYRKGIIRLGPSITFPQTSSICISLYVTMCSNCKIDIRLEKKGSSIEIKTSIEGDSDRTFMTWRNVRLQGEVSTSSTEHYQLYVTLSTKDGKYENTFWAVDDFRKCSNHEIRVASIISKKKLLCHSLKYPGWTFNPNRQVNNKDEPPVCLDGRYIGQRCNISCLSVIPNDGCGGQTICSSIQEGNQTACTCAAGYLRGPDSGCTQQCNYLYYGYNCKNKCGRCSNTSCNINTGECPKGCKDGYLPPFCQTRKSYPYLLSPPVVSSVFFTNITVKFNSLNIYGEKDSVHSIQLECKKANSWYSWVNCGAPINFNPGQEISITGLEKETSYLIRAIVYTKTGDAYRDNDVLFIEATTICKVDREIHVTVTSRSATISFKTEVNACSEDSYRIELLEQNRYPQIGKQKIILPDLTPYADYKIRITNILFPNYVENRNFQTKQDAPGAIENLSTLKIAGTTIIISWKEPGQKNGIVQKYTVRYKAIKRINCNDTLNGQSHTMNILPSMISKVIISDLEPYSTYDIKVAAETILQGTLVGYLENTKMISDISNEELPNTISTSDLSARSVTISWTVNCLKQRGPLYFQIVLKCVQDKWCDQISDIVLDNVTSLNGESTTHDLTSFTHYSVKLRAKRSERGNLTVFSKIIELYSSAEYPPAVDANYYSKDLNSISLRWLNPYPPHGHLDKYAIKYCYNNTRGCWTIEITNNQLRPCDLWNEPYNCYKFANLYSNYQYTITITAKNNESILWGPETVLIVNTTEDKSSAPLNLTQKWENNEIKLSWNHPNITNGHLKKFIITLNQTGTDLEDQDETPYYSAEYLASEEMKTYSYTINKTYRYSSSYFVEVCGVNSLYGENATLYIDTSPEIPEFTGDVIVDKETTTASTVTVIIPGVKKETSFLYVVVSKIHSTSETINANKEHNLEEEILKYSNHEDAWIAEEITDLNEKKIKILLGSGKTITSYHLNKKLINRNLEPSTAYEVTLVLKNTYKNKSSFNVYHHNIRTASKSYSELYGLMVFLALPVAIYLLYKFIRKKQIEATYITTEINARCTYLEIIPTEEINSEFVGQNKEETDEHIYETPDDVQNPKTRMNNIPEEEDPYFDSVYSVPHSPTYMNLLLKEREYANL